MQAGKTRCKQQEYRPPLQKRGGQTREGDARYRTAKAGVEINASTNAPGNMCFIVASSCFSILKRRSRKKTANASTRFHGTPRPLLNITRYRAYSAGLLAHGSSCNAAFPEKPVAYGIHSPLTVAGAAADLGPGLGHPFLHSHLIPGALRNWGTE